MSFTVSNCEQINRAPTNCSTAKQLYSFPKAGRFGYNPKILNQNIGYDLPSTMSTRKASFGIGNKSTKLKKKPGPDPGAYNLPTEFSNTPKNKAFTFGLPFSSYTKMYNKGDVRADKSVPGPGTYDIPER